MTYRLSFYRNYLYKSCFVADYALNTLLKYQLLKAGFDTSAGKVTKIKMQVGKTY